MIFVEDISNLLYDIINYIYNYIDRVKARENRHYIVSIMEKYLKKTSISSDSWVSIIRSIHMTGPFVLLLIILISQYEMLSHISLLILFIIPILFILLDGCILTSLEKKLKDDGFTVIDPLLQLMGTEINVKNRLKINYLTCLLFLTIGIVLKASL